MGLSLKKIVKSAGGLIGGLIGGPPGAAIGGALQASLQDSGAGGPDIVLQGPVGQSSGGMMPTAAPLLAGMTAIVGQAIAKLAGRLGISIASGTIAAFTRTGTRIWSALTGFAQRHPGLSLFSMLTALGLTAEEAASFIAWGSTRRRRRRGRGISARDLRTTRRTIRSVVSISASLRALAGGGGFSRRRALPRALPPHRHISVR